MTTAKELKAAERQRAAIRRAAPIYVQTEAGAAKAAAEAAREAEAKAAAAARAALPKSAAPLPEAKPARLAWHTINGREYAAADARAFWAEQRRLDRAAREAARAEARRAELSVYSAGLVLDGMTEAELRAAADKAAAAASKAASKAEAAELRAARAAAEQQLELVARAEALGCTVEDVLEADAIEALLAPSGRSETFADAPEAGAYSLLSPAELAELARFTKTALSQPAAAAGRAALDAMGMTSTGIVTTNVYRQRGSQLAIGQMLSTPKLEAAEARAAELAEQHKTAAARAAAADKAAKLAKTATVREARAAAEARADKAAEAAGKLAAKLARAEAALEAAKLAEQQPEASRAGYFVWPVATLELAEAARAAALPIPHKAGRMPATYAYHGPEAKRAAARNDNTAREAIANVMGQTAEAEAAAAEAIAELFRQRLAELTAAAAEARAKQRSDYKARQAMAARQRRRAAKQRGK